MPKSKSRIVILPEGLDIWQCEAYQTSPRQAVESFARTNWEEPRKIEAMTPDGKFTLADGTMTYQVLFVSGVHLQSVDTYHVYRLTAYKTEE